MVNKAIVSMSNSIHKAWAMRGPAGFRRLDTISVIRKESVAQIMKSFTGYRRV